MLEMATGEEHKMFQGNRTKKQKRLRRIEGREMWFQVIRM